jgi:hypothetical protein
MLVCDANVQLDDLLRFDAAFSLSDAMDFAKYSGIRHAWLRDFSPNWVEQCKSSAVTGKDVLSCECFN